MQACRSDNYYSKRFFIPRQHSRAIPLCDIRRYMHSLSFIDFTRRGLVTDVRIKCFRDFDYDTPCHAADISCIFATILFTILKIAAQQPHAFKKICNTPVWLHFCYSACLPYYQQGHQSRRRTSTRLVSFVSLMIGQAITFIMFDENGRYQDFTLQAAAIWQHSLHAHYHILAFANTLLACFIHIEIWLACLRFSRPFTGPGYAASLFVSQHRRFTASAYSLWSYNNIIFTFVVGAV